MRMSGRPVYLGLAPPFLSIVVTPVLVITGVLPKLPQYYVNGISSPINLYKGKINCTNTTFLLNVP